MDICDRINQIIEKEGLTIASFARKIGVGDQTVRSVVILRRNKPGYDFLLKISQTFEWLNINWLITGLGEMEINNSVENVTQIDYSSQYDDIIKNLITYLHEKDAKIEQLVEEKTMWRFKYLQLHNSENS